MIEQAEAVSIARDRASELGWGFADPVAVTIRRRWSGKISRFEIETNAGQRGTKARFVIDADTREIISEGFVPR